MRKYMTTVAVAAVALACVSVVQADVVLEAVAVGNVGNVSELSGAGAGGWGTDAVVGGVAYAYNIGKYEVTAGQDRDFLNAVDPTGSNPYLLYNSSMNSNPYGCQITWNAGSSTHDFSGRPSHRSSW